MKIVIDENRDYHMEREAFFSRWDNSRKERGLPRIIHNHNRYITGKIKDTETNTIRMVIAPIVGSEDWSLLKDCWWNKEAKGAR